MSKTDTDSNEPASPIGEGGSVTRNVIPMALHRVREYARKECRIAMEQSDQLEALGKYSARNATRQYARAMHKMACFVARELDAIATQPEGTKPRT